MEDNKQEEGNIEEEIGRYNLTENIDRVTRVVRGLTNKIIINDLRKIFKWVKDNPKFLGCPIIPDKARYMNYRGETAILDMGGRVVGVLDDSGQTVDFKSRPNHLPEFFRVETYSKEEIKNFQNEVLTLTRLEHPNIMYFSINFLTYNKNISTLDDY